MKKHHVVGGKTVDVKKAISKSDLNSNRGGGGGGRSGGGGRWGGGGGGGSDSWGGRSGGGSSWGGKGKYMIFAIVKYIFRFTFKRKLFFCK